MIFNIFATVLGICGRVFSLYLFDTKDYKMEILGIHSLLTLKF